MIPSSDQPISLPHLGAVALRRWRIFVSIPLALMTIVATVVLASHRTWIATASFAPRSSDSRSGLGAVAAQLGLAVPGSDPSQSPDFFAEILRSREILGPIADSSYGLNGRRVTLAEAYAITVDAPKLRRERVLAVLGQSMVVDRNLKTGVVTASVRSPDANVSYQIVSALLRQVNEFNLRTRQDKATAEVRFVEERLDALRRELRSAEDRVLDFRLRNRVALAPTLQDEFERLQRDVVLRQQVVTALSQAYEQARIDAVRNTPVITIVQRPEVPVLPQSRQFVLKMLLAGIVGVTLATVYVALAFAAAGTRVDNQLAS